MNTTDRQLFYGFIYIW